MVDDRVLSTLCTRGYGCSGHPVFPAPSLRVACVPLGIALRPLFYRGQMFPKPRAHRAAGSRVCVHVSQRDLRAGDSLLSGGKPASTPVSSAGLAFSGSCVGGRLHQTCAAAHIPSRCQASPDPLQFGHEANSGFRLGPGAYTLAYSPKTASAAVKPPQ